MYAQLTTESLSDTLAYLIGIGYPLEFALEPSYLYCPLLDLKLAPEEFDVREVYYFDKNTPREDEQLIYVISSSTRIKGTMVLTRRDAYAENMSFEMALKLRTHPYGEWICS